MDNSNNNLSTSLSTLHPKHSMLTNSKYTAPWQALKENKSIILTVLDAADKAKVIRGISQLKNIDLEWKTKDNNYYLRVKAEVLRKTKEGYLVLKVSLVDSIKYRDGIL